MLAGERQVAPTLAGIRRDHLARYEWAAATLPPRSRVLDLACGVGYGAWILARAGHRVTAIDRNAEAIAYAQRHYPHRRIRHLVADATCLPPLNGFDAAVCFETIEHLADPRPLLDALHAAAPVLLASVPNEDVFPWWGYQFHHRHYTPDEFQQLIGAAGFRITGWHGQSGPESEVTPDPKGRTMIVKAKRNTRARKPSAAPPPAPVEAPQPKVPESVVLLGLGPSLEAFVQVTKGMGSVRSFCDEVWGINAVGSIIQCDRVFHMDDVRIQEIRAAARPESNIANMLRWLRGYRGGPVYTSRPHHDYPSLAPYPLQAVMHATSGVGYFNNTAAYAVAFAVAMGVKKLTLFGCDFTYPDSHKAEKGRACVEFWLGYGRARGMEIGLPDGTSLMDAIGTRGERFYGYDTVDVVTGADEGGALTVEFVPHDRRPTADEIEHAYDHGRHPNSLVEKGIT